MQYSEFDTSKLPKHARLRAWREAATAVWDISQADDQDFHATVKGWHGADLIFGTVTSSSQITDRTEEWIARDGYDYFMLQFYQIGSRQITSRYNDAVARNGDLVTLDMTQVVHAASSRYQSNDLVIPRRNLAHLLTLQDSHGGRVHDGRLPLVKLLRQHLAALTEAAPKLRTDQMTELQPATLALVAATLNGVVTEDIAPDVRRSLLLPIRKYVDHNILDPALNANSIAMAFGLSRATLYRIMKPHSGIASFILERRLRGCRADLLRLEMRHKPISEIMLRWGFTSAQSFSSMFRRAFGKSPREYRNEFTRQRATVLTEIDSNWSRWIKEM